MKKQRLWPHSESCLKWTTEAHDGMKSLLKVHSNFCQLVFLLDKVLNLLHRSSKIYMLFNEISFTWLAVNVKKIIKCSQLRYGCLAKVGYRLDSSGCSGRLPSYPTFARCTYLIKGQNISALCLSKLLTSPLVLQIQFDMDYWLNPRACNVCKRLFCRF